MRGTNGAVDKVWLENGMVCFHVMGEGRAEGLCGSGLLDLAAVLLELGEIDEGGYMENGIYRLENTDVVLTQKDVRELQLAKAAVRAGVELLCEKMGIDISEIKKVYLAGAFGNYMNPMSACRIGMIPKELFDKIVPIGNAAGEGAKLCAVSRREYEYSKILARNTEFLELASLSNFQDVYVDSMEFPE